MILERPWNNPASRVTGELTALVGARVMGNTAILLLWSNSPCWRGSDLDFGGRDGIRTQDLLIANGESLKLRRVATIS